MPDQNPGAEPVITHGLVYLRPAEREDIALFVRWFSDARTIAGLAARAPFSFAAEERWFDAMVERQGKDHWFFVICRRSDARPVGNIALMELDSLDGSAGLGIMIGDPADTGHGYGGDAIRALLRFGFGQLRLERVWLDVFDTNERARRLYERLGFVTEGILRHAHWRDDRWVDVYRMSILRDEFVSRPRPAGSAPG